ncbi:CHC2 zinc finger domain-containing protein [Amycolatopsis decaplanina]|uniref:DNA primase n=1 Tax=Amycolatopsis decaplanina DSM 44594 TaxID=1284240 RepID=M2ZEB4_9PSEU|nr:CHC2 zinc finger domain-containing protein [Amycolatopsis decaplanina]EME59263.1 DNA primase [Amycolatopsis decaplanina DSM 44594]
MAITAISAPEPPGPNGIVKVVAPHVELSPLGDSQLQGSCPFCGSRAFRVRPAYGTFHCFGCGDGGDAQMFAAKISHIECNLDG